MGGAGGQRAGSAAVRAYWIGAEAVWGALWVATAVVLHGSTGEFGAMLPILVIGTVIGLGATRTDRLRHRIGQIVLWTVLLIATVLVLAGSSNLPAELAVLGVGALWHLVVAPLLLFTGTGRARAADGPIVDGGRVTRPSSPAPAASTVGCADRAAEAEGEGHVA